MTRVGHVSLKSYSDNFDWKRTVSDLLLVTAFICSFFVVVVAVCLCVNADSTLPPSVSH